MYIHRETCIPFIINQQSNRDSKPVTSDQNEETKPLVYKEFANEEEGQDLGEKGDPKTNPCLLLDGDFTF